MKKALTIAGLVLGLCVACAIALAPFLVVGCSSPPAEPPVVSTPTKQKLAEGTFTASLLRCVDSYPADDPRVDECADAVRAAWRKDGGR